MKDTHPKTAVRGRSPALHKRASIIAAATDLFLRNGYLATSMDDIAAQAGVAKQTVYSHFHDKENLFTQMVAEAAAKAQPFIDESILPLAASQNFSADLFVMARKYLSLVVNPAVLQLRQLIIGEAARFPGLARQYYAAAPDRTVAALASVIAVQSKRGILKVPDPEIAAHHLAFLILGLPLDRALFHADEKPPSVHRLNTIADAGVAAFLAIYSAR